jgi:hypothetical protein
MKRVKHMYETTKTLATHVYRHWNICNIQMKHLETTFETHLKQNMALPAAMAYLVGNCGSQQAALGCSGEGGWQQASG